jgi:hypothetical protein
MGVGGWAGGPPFSLRLTNNVGAPSFPIVWERVGVDTVHISGSYLELLYPDP